MKNIKLIAMTAAMGMVFAACEPTLIDGPEPFAPVEATVLANGITYQQFADEACTQPDDAGNFLKYNSTAGVVQVFQEGNNSPLYTGAGGVVKIPVKRGQEPSANLVFRLINGDGTFTEAVKTVACTPPTELSPEMLILASDYGQKVWKYAPGVLKEGDNYYGPYGNAGYTESGAGFNAPAAIDGQWWGVKDGDALTGQLSHAGGTATGDESNKAYMVFSEDGVVTTYDSTGVVIRSGKFEVKDYDPSRSSGWGIGKLTTSEPALLFPWKINGDGTPVTEYDIMYLTPQHMNLTHVPAGTGGWSEITYWRFIAASPDPLTIAGTWTYATGVLKEGDNYYGPYGNAGYTESGAGFNAPAAIDGQWWGVKDGDALADQLAHAGGSATGDESNDAYMVFEGNTVNTYAPDGTKIRGGDYEIVMNNFADGAGRGAKGWELGKLTTSEPALLFPWKINGGGTPVTEFDIMYFTSEHMTLTHVPEGTAGWSEITYWQFVRKTE